MICKCITTNTTRDLIKISIKWKTVVCLSSPVLLSRHRSSVRPRIHSFSCFKFTINMIILIILINMLQHCQHPPNHHNNHHQHHNSQNHHLHHPNHHDHHLQLPCPRPHSPPASSVAVALSIMLDWLFCNIFAPNPDLLNKIPLISRLKPPRFPEWNPSGFVQHTPPLLSPTAYN